MKLIPRIPPSSRYMLSVTPKFSSYNGARATLPDPGAAKGRVETNKHFPKIYAPRGDIKTENMTDSLVVFVLGNVCKMCDGKRQEKWSEPA